MFKKLAAVLASTVIAVAALSSAAQARDSIRIVGSSTVFPFATVVAEKLGSRGKYKTPVVESTGTGGGMKLFCAGVGVGHPDFTSASRAIKASEMPGATAARLVSPEVPMLWKESIMPSTVPNSPTKGAHANHQAQ